MSRLLLSHDELKKVIFSVSPDSAVNEAGMNLFHALSGKDMPEYSPKLIQRYSVQSGNHSQSKIPFLPYSYDEYDMRVVHCAWGGNICIFELDIEFRKPHRSFYFKHPLSNLVNKLELFTDQMLGGSNKQYARASSIPYYIAYNAPQRVSNARHYDLANEIGAEAVISTESPGYGEQYDFVVWQYRFNKKQYNDRWG